MFRFLKRLDTLSEKEVLKILNEVHAVITNSHIIYTSGKHGSVYINKDAIYPYTKKTSNLCLAIAKTFSNLKPDVVIAPAIGGVILSQLIGQHLSRLTRREVLAVYAEKGPDGKTLMIKRGYDKMIQGKRVLAVEDVLNTGGSIKQVVSLVREAGGYVIGVGALCNRGGVTPEDLGDVPELFALVNIKFDAWEEADCPLCRDNIPINTSVGKGKEYLQKKAVGSL